MSAHRVGGRVVAAVSALCLALVGQAEVLPTRGTADARVRIAAYNPDQVYRINGFVGYQIDLQFEEGETFEGLGAGDIEGLAFAAQDNHLFLKPKAATVGTNLTVLTNRRHYHFDYTASWKRPDPLVDEVIYSVRFSYPQVAAAAAEQTVTAARIEAALAAAPNERSRNYDYWYCGTEAIRPVAASDDGIHTRLTFPANAELPAIFVRNDDGTESLLNFSMDAGDVIVHRVARRFVLRRGQLTGCIVNQGFGGSGTRLPSGTVSSGVERITKGHTP
jgi:type IV secretion system protein VirB9